MSRLILSGKFEKDNGWRLKAGATTGSADIVDYEPVVTDGYTVGVEHEDVIPFPPLKAVSHMRFQGGGNSEPFVFRVAYKLDDKPFVVAPVRVIPAGGVPTPDDAVALPIGAVAVSIIRMDAGLGAVGYVLDLEV